MSEQEIAEKFMHPLLKDEEAGPYEKKLEMDLILKDGNDGTENSYHFFIFENAEARIIRLEITRESDIFWILSEEIAEDQIAEFQKKQKFFKKVTYDKLISNLEQVLKNVQTNRSSFTATFTTSDQSQFELVITQQLEFKQVEILRIPFVLLEEDENHAEYINDQAQFRYSVKLNEYEREVNRLKELFDTLEADPENRQLCAQLRKQSKITRK